MAFFCPCCFAEIDQAVQSCPFCGVDIALWIDRPYNERLLHALGHPLADVRMTAIEALRRQGEPLAAEPLARCALAHPLDVTQGMAILRALSALRRDASWSHAVDSLLQHPIRAIAAAAADLRTRVMDQSVDPISASSEMPAQIHALIDDFANHGEATELIMALGEGAIVPLRRYLSAGAQVIPQGRLFAVSMLARLRSPQAREGLREVLYDTPLRDLPVAWQDAEYQVKDATVRLLLARAYPERLTDAIHAVEQERLPSAVAMVGELGLPSLAPVLMTMLEDDVLERAAGHSLEGLGTQGQTAILLALPALFDDAQSRVRSRIALLRALLLLHRLHVGLPSWAIQRAHEDAHPGVRAAGALFVDRPDREVVAVLVRGTLSDYPALAWACRERLASGGLEFVTAALEALKRNGEPDIYGNQHRLRKDTIRWLITEILTASRTDPRARRTVIAGMDPELLTMGLVAAHIPTVEFFDDSKPDDPC